ncbi:hypothetical protein M6B38_194075 [Iris pallida]|uniref:Uncharacterized protein n=1 Tax=Iris pallida TaxID=29817 RepID=A0AAX6EDS8_IRIPA|nr:hypothetical protein M6B38_194075 [Iris pallida]
MQEERRMSLGKYQVHDETSQVSNDCFLFYSFKRIFISVCRSNWIGRQEYLCFPISSSVFTLRARLDQVFVFLGIDFEVLSHGKGIQHSLTHVWLGWE